MKLLLGVVMFCLSFPAPAVEVEKPKFVAVRAYLYYHGTGTWSPDVTDKKFHIWNASIGEGSMKSSAARTMFVVEAKGPSHHKMKIKITYKADGKTSTVHQSTEEFDFLNPGETMKVPVLIRTVGIGEYILTATMDDPSPLVEKPLSISKTVVFAGGE